MKRERKGPVEIPADLIKELGERGLNTADTTGEPNL